MKKSRLTDTQLAERAAEYKRLRAEEAAAKTLAESHRDVILDELAARRALSVSVGDYTVTAKSNRRTSYDVAAAKEILKPAQLRKISQVTILHASVQAEVQAGNLTQAEVDAFAKVEMSAPYLAVTAA